MSSESVQGAVRPQIEQSSMGKGRQFGQIGPSGVRQLTMRDSPQTVQVSRFAGSLIRQTGHRGRPWASRLAGSRRAPQRTHSSMRDLAMQLRQTRCPSSGLSMRTTPESRIGPVEAPVLAVAQAERHPARVHTFGVQ